MAMAIAYSKVTTRGRTSVPAEIVRRLGGPGSMVEWYEKDGEIFLRRKGKDTSQKAQKSISSGPGKRGKLTR